MIVDWLSKATGLFAAGSSWQGGKAPGTGDTGVISGSGDPAQVKNPELGLSISFLTPGVGSSLSALSNALPLAQETRKSNVGSNGETTYYYTSPPESDVDTGETISGVTIDLEGAGREVGLYLQKSTLESSTTVNVSGDALLSSGYTNTSYARINVGIPFTVGGNKVPTPATDPNGFVNALYLGIEPLGSWSYPYALSGYVPAFTNRGVITVGASSALIMSIAKESAGTVKGANSVTLNPPEQSSFVNDGTVAIQGGGLMNVYSPYDNASFVNDGTVSITGAANLATSAAISASVSGTGTFDVYGGTQSTVTKTGLVFHGPVSGEHFNIKGAFLGFDAGTGAVPPSLSATGGTVDFTGSTGLLEVVAPIDASVNKVFSDTIGGFIAGDQIELNYGLLPLASGDSWKPELSFNATTDTLTITNVFEEGGIISTSSEGTLKFTGSYGTSQFYVASHSTSGTQATLVIGTSHT